MHDPGAPASVVTALGPVTSLALRFQPMDYFLLALFGLTAVGSLTPRSFSRSQFSALLGVLLALIGLDSVVGTPRLTLGIRNLKAGVSTVPALVGLLGFAERLSVTANGAVDGAASSVQREAVRLRSVLKEFWRSLYYCAIGTFGGALIPMMALGIPGDAVTAIILSVFYVHGLQPGPAFLMTGAESFCSIMAGGLLGCVFLLLLGLLVAPRISRVINVPRRILLPIVAVLCVIGSYACSNRLFDVGIMFFFGIFGFLLRTRGYSVAPVTLGLVLGGMMDANFRRAVSLAPAAANLGAALFRRPITMILLALTLATVTANIPGVRRMTRRRSADDIRAD